MRINRVKCLLQTKTRLRPKERRGRGTLKMRMMKMMIKDPLTSCLVTAPPPHPPTNARHPPDPDPTPQPSQFGRLLGHVPILKLVSFLGPEHPSETSVN